MPSQSQLYSYIAPNTKGLLADKGDLWAFVSDTPGVKNYYDVFPGSGMSVTGHFIKVPRDIATGLNPDGSELKAADKGYPAAAGQRELADRPPLHRSGRHRRPPVGAPALERPQPRVPVRAGRGHRLRQAARQGQRRLHRRLREGPDRTAQSLDTPNFRSTNGRVWKMVLDPNDPKKVTSLTVFVEGDDNPVKTPTEIHQPDNLESTPQRRFS